MSKLDDITAKLTADPTLLQKLAEGDDQLGIGNLSPEDKTRLGKAIENSPLKKIISKNKPLHDAMQKALPFLLW
jgi:hypothetical protein